MLDALPPESRSVIIDVLGNNDPALLAVISKTSVPTTAQSRAVENALATVLVKNFDENYVPNEFGRQIERALNVYFEAWPINE